MKLQNIANIDALFQTIEQCSGKVELVGEDIRLNLKSKLVQYFSLAKLFSDGEIPEMEIITENAQDTARLIHFMMRGNE